VAILHNPGDQYRLAALRVALGPTKGTPATLALHTGFDPADINDTLNDAAFMDRCDSMDSGKYRVWGDVLANAEIDVGRFLHRLAPDAVMAIERALDSPDAKERMVAAKLVLDYDPFLQRPTVTHEVNYRFSPEELDKARAIARSLRPALPTAPAKESDGPATPTSVN